MPRRLTLARERLAELTPADLESVAGAALPTLRDCVAISTGTCDRLSLPCLTGHYPSINDPCTTD